MSSGTARVRDPDVPTGNTFDKHASSNPVLRRLVDRFEATLLELLMLAAPASVLDVGCGEGRLTARWAQALGDRPVLGVDLEDSELRAHWSCHRRANLSFRAASATALPFEPGSFDLVSAVESLEHIAQLDRALSEMHRVAGRHLLVSVPREPLWRALNTLRGAYLNRLGNTPGHVNHFSKVALLKLLRLHGEVLEVRSPLPWTVALVRVN